MRIYAIEVSISAALTAVTEQVSQLLEALLAGLVIETAEIAVTDPLV